MKNYRGKTLLALPMLAPGSSIKENLRGENLMTQLQSAYLLTREKFDHQIAEISMRCKVYINTDPVSDEEIDAAPTYP